MGGRYRIRISEELCKGCALCVDACRQGLVRMAERLNARGHRVAEPADTSPCSGCGHCADMCPEAAIEIEPADQARTAGAAHKGAGDG
jgi:2-oxoglutarate ferredoxin oxidoreductase subunit delta